MNIKKPEIICICGSTRFADLHAIMKWEFEKDGEAICLMINYLPEWYAKEMGWNSLDHFGEQEGNKDILDELHLRKIDLANKVFVINKNGYIGESTKREIEYAQKLNKPILYLEPINKEVKKMVNIKDVEPNLVEKIDQILVSRQFNHNSSAKDINLVTQDIMKLLNNIIKLMKNKKKST